MSHLLLLPFELVEHALDCCQSWRVECKTLTEDIFLFHLLFRGHVLDLLLELTILHALLLLLLSQLFPLWLFLLEGRMIFFLLRSPFLFLLCDSEQCRWRIILFFKLRFLRIGGPGTVSPIRKSLSIGLTQTQQGLCQLLFLLVSGIVSH